MAAYQIREGSIVEVVQLSLQVPEFDNPHPAVEYQHRLQAVPHLILIAEVDGKPSGFKVGYQKGEKVFYSWMGGVLPEYRPENMAFKKLCFAPAIVTGRCCFLH